MNFQDAEKIYRGLKQQNVAGKLSDAEFEAQVGELWCQDAQGTWWQIGVETGDWYMYDGQNWTKATPPSTPSAPAAPQTPSANSVPSAPPTPPAPSTPAIPPPVPAASAAPVTPPPAPIAPSAPSPAPAPVTPPRAPAVSATPLPPVASSAAVESGTAQQDTRDSVLPPQWERVAPAGSGKRLPTPVLVGIAAVVAVVAFALVIGGCFFITGLLGSGATARATTTPTRSLALLQSPVPPTPTEVPTDTPLPSSTIEVTPTHTATRPAVRRPTPTPVGPTATATLNVPPGVYVTNVETVPAKVNIGDTIGFKVSFLNTTGSVQTYNWYVKWYECPEQCQDFKHSQGETLEMNSNLAPGSSTLSTSQNITIRPGIRCDLIAIANYIDPVNQLPTPFQSTKSDGHFSFTACH